MGTNTIPLPKPVYPGSKEDVAEKARIAKIKTTQAEEKMNRSGNPFGA